MKSRQTLLGVATLALMAAFAGRGQLRGQEAEPANAKSIVIKGKTVDRDGKPVGGVEITPGPLFKTTVTADDGTFELRIPEPTMLCAIAADGLSAGFAEVRAGEREFTSVLNPSAVARGRLVDPQGNPVTVGTIEATSESTFRALSRRSLITEFASTPKAGTK